MQDNMGKYQGREFYDEAYCEGGGPVKGRKLRRNYFVPPEESVYIESWDMVCSLLGPEDRVADFGCGVGQFAELLVSRGISFVYGVDFSSVAIAEAVKRVPVSKGVFVCGDLVDPELFLLHSYTVATLLEVLEHVRDDLGLLSNVPRGTRVIFSVPYFDAGSHVRYFIGEEDVRLRYDSVVDIASCSEVELSPGAVVCVVSGKIR